MRRNDPGRPEVCVVFSYHKKFNPAEVEEIEAGCRSGALGCVDCKLNCASKISKFLEPVLEKRKTYENNISLVLDVIADGEKAARAVANETMTAVRKNMNLG